MTADAREAHEGRPAGRLALYRIQVAREKTLMLGWAAGLLVYFFIIGVSYATVKDHPGLDDVWAELPEELREAFGGAPSITTPGGYLESQGTSLLPLILGGVLLSQATRRLSGAEQQGELDLVLSLPVRRGTYFWAHWGVGVTHAVAWTLGALVGTVAGMAAAGVRGETLLRIAYMVVEVLPFALAVHAGAMLAGAALHRRPPGLAILSAALALAFLLQIVGSLDDSVSWLRWFSPYALWMKGEPFEYRTDPWYMASVVLIVGACLPLALRAWLRKDLKG